MDSPNSHLISLSQALVFVASKLNQLHLDWFLGSSAALMVQGIEIVPKDIDILTLPQNVAPILSAFKIYQDPDRDDFGLNINGIDVEIIGYIQNTEISRVGYMGVLIPVDSLENKLNYYRSVPGKEYVVKLIEDHLAMITYKSKRL
jgi:hypothetical protein